MAEAVLDALEKLRSPGLLFSILGLSVLCWVAECLVLVFIWVSFGGSTDVLTAPLLGFALGTLATLIPSLPGHFGPFDYFAVEGLMMGGAQRDIATGVTLLTHLVLWVPTTLAGLVWLITPSPRTKPAVSAS